MTREKLRRLLQAGLTLAAFSLCFGIVGAARAQTEPLNLSCDPTRELSCGSRPPSSPAGAAGTAGTPGRS